MNIKNINTEKKNMAKPSITSSGICLSTAIALALSISLHADTQKYPVTVANFTNKALNIELKSAGSCKSVKATLQSQESKDYWDRDCKLKYLQVGKQTIDAPDPKKGALFLIELDESGHGFMVTPFVNDSNQRVEWDRTLSRAKAKLHKKKIAQLIKERDQELAEQYREYEKQNDISKGYTGRNTESIQWTIDFINQQYNKKISELDSLIK